MYEEKRRYTRVPTLLYTIYSDGNRFFKELVRDASPGGLLIESSEPSAVGTSLYMAIDAHVSIKAKGTVTWIKKHGHVYKIGVQLKEMNADTATEWANFLSRSQGLVGNA